MNICYVCNLPTSNHNSKELRKCLGNLSKHKEQSDKLIKKLLVLLT